MQHQHAKKTLAGFAIFAAALMFVGPGQAATSATGSVSAHLDQFVEISATDAAIALGTATPTSGSDVVRHSTVDGLAFSNAKSNVQSVWDMGISASLTKDADGATVTDAAVSYQGTSSNVQDLVYLANASSGAFMPWKISTGTDLSAEGTGWTSHADCAAQVYKGSFSFQHFSNGGAKQAATTLYYMVCDASTELYVGSTKDLSAGDKAIIITEAVAGAQATAANYQVVLQSTPYVFYSAAGADSVTLRRGHHVDLGSDVVSKDVFALIEMPDGLPAGDLAVTLTASAGDINNS